MHALLTLSFDCGQLVKKSRRWIADSTWSLCKEVLPNTERTEIYIFEFNYILQLQEKGAVIKLSATKQFTP